MPHVDRDCSYFWSSRLCAAICISTMHTSPTYRCLLAAGTEGERRGGRGWRDEGGQIEERAFFKAPHRSAATDRPANRSTSNKSRRFLRRAARVRSCPVFGNRSDEEERSLHGWGEEAGEATNNARRPLELFLAAV